MLAWGNCRHFATSPLFSPWNDVCETSAKIPYWWRFTTEIWVVLLIGCSKFPTRHDQSGALPRSGYWTSSVWNVCAPSSDVISRGNQWWRQEMSVFFSGYHSVPPLPQYSNFWNKSTKRKLATQSTVVFCFVCFPATLILNFLLNLGRNNCLKKVISCKT